MHNALKVVFGFVGDTCLSFPLSSCNPTNIIKNVILHALCILGGALFDLVEEILKIVLYMMCDHSFRLSSNILWNSFPSNFDCFMTQFAALYHV